MENRLTRRFFSAVGSSLLAFAAVSVVSADVLYVNHAADGNADGSSWQHAFVDLQAALAAATPGDELWIAAGTYRPALPGGSRSASFALKIGVALYGGFAGTESQREQRDWQANITILSGDLNADDEAEFVNTIENSYQVVKSYGVDATAILDGITIAYGRCDGPGLGAVPESEDQGSGINIYFSQPTIRNCTLLRNWSFNHGAVNDHGGGTFENCEFRENFSYQFGAGLYVHNGVATIATGCRFVGNVATTDGGGAYSRSAHGAILIDCVFDENIATRGAGMYHAPDGATTVRGSHFNANEAEIGGGGMYTELSSPLIEGCTFFANRAGTELDTGEGGGGGSGGGGTFSGGGAPIIRDCVFAENWASFGGGVYFNEGSAGNVSDCVFTGNLAKEAGGLYALESPVSASGCLFIHNDAIDGTFSVGGAVSNYFSRTTVRDSTFIANSAVLGGGAIYNEGLDPIIIGCRFLRNEAIDDAQGWGGAILNGFHTYAITANCTFRSNTANDGGAIFDLFSSESQTRNCTFIGNVAARSGGAFHAYLGTSPIIANGIFWNNAPDQIAGIPVDLRYSLITGGYTGPGNLDAVPLFVDLNGPDGVPATPDDDLTLAFGSPGIDAGSNVEAPAGEMSDLLGMARFVDDIAVIDGGEGAAPIIDMGAVERQRCRGDVDGDGDADLSDLTGLLANFGRSGGAAISDGDLDEDDDVDLNDLVILLGAFGNTCD